MTDGTDTTTGATGANSGEQTTTQANSGTEGAAGGAGAGKAGKGGSQQQQQQDQTGGSQSEPLFWEGFKDEGLKKSPVILRHKTVEDLARSLDHAEKRLGVPADQLIRKPSKPEEMPDVYRALGAPETPEGYKIDLPENASDEDKEAVASFAKHMHEKGPFPPDFVAAAVEWNNQQAEAATAALQQAQDAARTEGEAYLKKHLGASYDPDLTAVGKLLVDSKIEGLKEELDASGLGNSPRLIRFLHEQLVARAEPGELEGRNSGTGSGREFTPGEAKAQLAALNADPVKGIALRDRNHAMHRSVVKERDRLAALAEGRRPQDA